MYLEPPLEVGKDRIRWQYIRIFRRHLWHHLIDCPQACGEMFTHDYPAFQNELTYDYVTDRTTHDPVNEYALSGLDNHFHYEKMFGLRFLSVQMTEQTLRDGNTQKPIPSQPFAWLNRVIAGFGLLLRRSPEGGTLPQYRANATTANAPGGTPRQPTKPLHLLTCMRNARLGNSLHQVSIDTVETDRQLFDLRDLYKRKRGQIRTLLSSRTIKGIRISRIKLWPKGSVNSVITKMGASQTCAHASHLRLLYSHQTTRNTGAIPQVI